MVKKTVLNSITTLKKTVFFLITLFCLYHYYYCKLIVKRRTQASKPRSLIQKDT